MLHYKTVKKNYSLKNSYIECLFAVYVHIIIFYKDEKFNQQSKIEF